MSMQAGDRHEAGSNIPEMGVSEVSERVKKTMEAAYELVRVRGELGRVVRAKSGHLYTDLKDEKAVLQLVMWKQNVAALPFAPEEGMELIAEGRISTYPGRSVYQLIAARLAPPSGRGSLIQLLEMRREKLAAEGLFDQAHKKALPRFPASIGVVTSPSGAALQDILHRIGERFPVPVIHWPCLVQGPDAAREIAAGIAGLNKLSKPPDILIVARGGGSIEDLWAFSEEEVVCAAHASRIPLISAVGHETDTTLIDHVADMRAPTPSAAVELALPVTRADVRADVAETSDRITRLVRLRMHIGRAHIAAVAARLPRAGQLIGKARDRLDAVARLRPYILRHGMRQREERLEDVGRRLKRALLRSIEDKSRVWAGLCRVLQSASHERILERGYALVRRHEDGALLRRAEAVTKGEALSIVFADGSVIARSGSDGADSD